MPRHNSRGVDDELANMGNTVSTDSHEIPEGIIADPPTFPGSELNTTLQPSHTNSNANMQRQLINRNQLTTTTAARSPERQTNSPYQDSRIRHEENISVAELLHKTLVYLDRPMENLPPLTLPELKLIGRRVCFNSETKIGQEFVMMKYVGLVGTINKDTVMLIHVFRFKGSENGAYVMDPDKVLSEIKEKHSLGAGLTSEGVETFTWVSEPMSTATASLTSIKTAAPDPPDPQLPQLGGMVEYNSIVSSSERRLYSKVFAKPLAMGPIPFMTFSRSSINNVCFAHDSPNSFFTLFRDPKRKNFDMQCLRMFCRRYVVHTVQNNNPQRIPLRDFIACRCSCPNIDDGLLTKVAKEEIEHLVNIERAVKRAKKKTITINRNALREYVPPSGVFSRTGILYLTHIPQQTFMIGLIVAAFSLLLMIFYTFTLCFCTPFIIAPYIRMIRPYIYVGGSICLAAGVFSLTHSFFMSIFHQNNLKLSTIRFLFGAFSIGACFMMVVVVVQYLQQGNFSKFIRYNIIQNELDEYYKLKKCRGYNYPCIHDFWNSIDFEWYCHGGFSNETPCRKYLEHEYYLILNPMLCTVMLLLVFLCFEQFMHFKLIYISRMILSHYALT
ncbi:unnamed protein product [Phytomonas sp. Hart1]|nr:unnamed protein product [Phytomonas sp. Hart1]|eukprot:CCW66486.1 unnamed protein product [Phytomonas sp. isolate Hart1]